MSEHTFQPDDRVSAKSMRRTDRQSEEEKERLRAQSISRILERPRGIKLAPWSGTESPATVLFSEAGRAQVNYQKQTLRPLVSLAFVFPLILCHELCVIFLGNMSLRSGIDQWLDQALSFFGAGQMVLLPLLTAACLIIWHHRRHDPWDIRVSTLFGMFLESLILGLILFCAANACLQMSDSASVGLPSNFLQSMREPSWWTQSIASLGSGIYEEVVFRLIVLLPLINWLEKSTANRWSAIVVSVVLVSFVFSCLHYDVINPSGSPFELKSFIFRFSASLIFCGLFLFRGFGIAVGTHVAYDILTQI